MAILELIKNNNGIDEYRISYIESEYKKVISDIINTTVNSINKKIFKYNLRVEYEYKSKFSDNSIDDTILIEIISNNKNK